MAIRTVRDRTLRDRARDMRSDDTRAERALWGDLRAHRLGGWKWRRQVPKGNYIVDFLCDEGRLAVEVDGDVHLLQAKYDARRTAYLKTCGLRVLRFRNEEVLLERERVCLTILGWLGGARPGWTLGPSGWTHSSGGKVEPPPLLTSPLSALRG